MLVCAAAAYEQTGSSHKPRRYFLLIAELSLPADEQSLIQTSFNLAPKSTGTLVPASDQARIDQLPAQHQ